MALRMPARGRIAVVELFGVIGGSVRVPRYEQLFNSLRRSRRFRAVVLDIDSPGGSATASEYLYYVLSKLAKDKPLIAYIRGMGTSGACLLCCAAHQVIALPNAIVGSIGVISLRPVLQELLQRIGIGFSVAKQGRLKDMGAFYKTPTQEEQERFQSLVDEFYDSFVKTVAQARKLPEERVRELATGEVFTARRAQSLGLVDALGDLDAAIDKAAELGNVPRRPIYIRPRPGLRERLLGRFATALTDTVIEELEQRLSTRIFYQ